MAPALAVIPLAGRLGGHRSERQEPLLPKFPCCSRSDKRVLPGWPSGVGSLWARGDHHSLNPQHPCGLTSGFTCFSCWLPVLLALKFKQSLSSPAFPQDSRHSITFCLFVFYDDSDSLYEILPFFCFQIVPQRVWPSWGEAG